MPIINNPKTQSTVDNVLNTLQIWFGSGSNTPTTNTTTGGGGVFNPGGVTNPVRYNPAPKKDRTLTYVGVGFGVVVVGLTTYLIIKKRKK